MNYVSYISTQKPNKHMDTRTKLEEKYKNYQRVNTFKGWIKHFYLVLLSLFITKKYYK